MSELTESVPMKVALLGADSDDACSKAPFSLYIHIPFCSHKCPYCDFNTYAVGAKIPERDYVASLRSELDFRAAQPEWRGRSIATIFLGGGSPSLLSPSALRDLFRTVSRLFQIQDGAEVSIEANPNDTSLPWLAAIREIGINRLSIGAQTFQDHLLPKLGRNHSSSQIRNAIDDARRADFSNISIDLMFGIPEQTVADFASDLKAALELTTDHLSLYGLTIEAGTPFFQASKRGILQLPPEDATLEMMELAERTLADAGLVRYEISNYARPGFEAIHNISYWTRSDYLGIGAGAHSFWGGEQAQTGASVGRRWSNLAPFSSYIEHAAAFGKAESWEEILTPESQIFEQFFLGLRMVRGLETSTWPLRFGFSLAERYEKELSKFEREGLMIWERENERIAMTPRGFTLFDSIVEHFVSHGLACR